ncbi:MAG: flavodoxin domain-containing protein [Armatimonadota bacterium]
MSAVKIAENVYWVGAVDWNIRNFHGHTYTTRRGTTYNSYLIMDEKITLIDGVHAGFKEKLIDSIRQVVDPSKIDYVVANHVEDDHSGALPHIMEHCPGAKIFCTAKCKEGLYKHYFKDWDFNIVKSADKLNLGKRNLTFIEAPMLHWPDSMFTYIAEDQILFPNDAFGQHYASSGRFDNEVDQGALMEEAVKYYANILWPFSGLVLRKIEEIKKLNIPIKMIAPSHGIIWRADPLKIINAYAGWAENNPRENIVVIYETMWGATKKMADKIVEGITAAGVSVKLYDINVSDRTEVIKDMLLSRGYIAGSSTHDNNMLPNLAGFLELVKGFKPKNRIGASFGSYGWAGGAVKQIEEFLKIAGIEIIQPSLGLQYVPDRNELEKCYEFGKNFAENVKNKTYEMQKR